MLTREERLRMMEEDFPHLIGLPWFATADEYKRVREAVADPHNLEVDRRAFLEFIKNREYTEQSGGGRTTRVDVYLNALIPFAVRIGRQVSTAVIYEYARDIAYERTEAEYEAKLRPRIG